MRKLWILLSIILVIFGIAACTGSEEINLIFEENGGEEVEDMTISINSTSIDLPEPIRNGFEFDGWFTDEALTAPFTIAVLLTQQSEIVLYAKWTEILSSFTMTFETNGGSTIAPITLVAGATITPPADPTKSGYTFGGWFSDVGLLTAYTISTMPNANITIYAKWNEVIVTATLTFETNGGSLIAPITQNAGTQITAPANPSKTGYTFGGWYSDAALNLPYSFGNMPTSNFTIYAKWTANNYTITFEENGGSSVTDITQAYLSAVTEPANPTRDGYTFGGWYSDVALTTAYTFGTMPLNGITLYAKWTVNNYTITFEENGGSSVTDITQGYGTALVLPIPVKLYHAFDGWFTDIDLLIPFTEVNMPLGGATLYAKYTQNQYTLTWHDGISSPLVQVYGLGQAIIAPSDPVRVGYTFAGWFKDQLFLEPFDITVMTANHLNAYGKWTINFYTVVYNTHGGDFLIDDEIVAYNTPVPYPGPITKQGMIFDGWYADDTYTIPFDFHSMPASDITIHAKWIIDDGYTRISTILETNPYHVKVRGIIYYMFPGMNPGFYIYDGTGYMFVLGFPGSFVVGDVIEFEADYQPFENTPQLITITNLTSNSTPITMPEYSPMSFNEVSTADEHDPYHYGQPIIISGFLMKLGMTYYIADLGGDRPIAINYKSVTPMNDPFMAALGSRVTFQAIIHDFNGYNYEWHILYSGHSNAVVVENYTDQDKVDELLLFGESMLDGRVFYVGQTFMIPTLEPVFGATISAVTFGVNASLYNPTTGVFQPVVEEKIIDLRITVTINQATGFIEVQIILKPVELLSIEDFKLAEDMGYYKVQGVILISHPMFGIAVIADETGTLVIMLDESSTVQGEPIEIINQFKPGDLVIVGGYKMPFEGVYVLVGGEEGLDIEVIGVDQESPLISTPITISQFNALDVYNPIYWVQYFEIRGTIVLDELEHMVYLTDGIHQLPMVIFDKDMYSYFSGLTEFDLVVRGISLPNFDGIPSMMFIFTGLPDAIEPDYTDEEFIDLIKIMLQTFLESLVFYPGQIAELPLQHPVFDIFVEYAVTQEDSHLINILTMQISPDITEDTWISLIATLTYGTATGIVDIELFVQPIDILTVAEFLQVTDEEMYYVQGVVLFIQLEQNMIIIADSTGILMSVSTNEMIQIGDLVLLKGMLMNSEGMMILANDPEQTVQSIMNSGVPHPLVATPITLEAFNLLDATDPSLHLKYYELEGTLMINPMGDMFYLSEGEENVPIFVASPSGYEHLMEYVGVQVRIKGFAMRAGSELFMVLVYIDYPGDIDLRFTDAELALFLADQIEGYYQEKILRPGAFHVLPDTYPPYEFTVLYEVFGLNAGLYTLSTGAISHLIEEEIFIDIRATITVGEAVEIVEFQLHVVPIDTQTIAEFKAGVDGDFFMLRGIVVLSNFGGDGPAIIADATGHLFIAPMMDLVIGDEVIISGYRATHEGIALMWDPETTILVEVLSHNMPNPMTLVSHTIDSLWALDMEDRNNWGIFVEVVGYLGFMDDSYMPLITEGLGTGDFLPFMPMFMMQEEPIIQIHNPFDSLRMLQGLRLRLVGFLIPNLNVQEYEPDRMLVIAREQGLSLDYATDQERMDALIDLGTYHLETSKIFRPGDTIELPSVFEPLQATLVWTYIGSSTEFIDLDEMLILEITAETQFLFQVVITIGELEVTHVFTLTAQPYPILSIDEFYQLEHDEYAKVLVIVLYKTPYGDVIFHDRVSSSYLYGEGYPSLQVGDEVIIFTQKREYDRFILASGYAWNARIEPVATLQSLPYVVTETELEVLAKQADEVAQPMLYHLVQGRLIYNTWDNAYYLTDGLNTIMLQIYDQPIRDVLSTFIDHDVRLSCFNYQLYYTAFGPRWTCIVVQDAIFNVTLLDSEIADIMKAYIMHEMGLLYKDGLSYHFSTSHPIYGGTYSFVLDPANALDATLTGNVIQFAESEFPNTVTLHVTATINGFNLDFAVDLAVTAYEDPMQSYNPGSMGMIPVVSGTLPPNTFGGLRVVEVDRHDDWFGGTDLIVDLEFPYPWELGFSELKLQYYDPVDLAWYDLIYYGMPLVTTWNNFSLKLDGPMTVRLISDHGSVSNVVSFGYTSVETYFAGWSLDQSMYLTGIMSPFVGSGLKLESVTVYNSLTGQEVSGGISLQWYRVNPYTWEEIMIPGANQPLYVTTMNDVGYMMMVKVTGDEVNVGGMMKIYSQGTINILNRGYVTNTTTTGFDIGFDYMIDINDLDQLQIYNNSGQMLMITSITETSIPNVFHVEVDLRGLSSIQIHINNMTWTLGSEQVYHDMIGLYVYLLE